MARPQRSTWRQAVRWSLRAGGRGSGRPARGRRKGAARRGHEGPTHQLRGRSTFPEVLSPERVDEGGLAHVGDPDHQGAVLQVLQGRSGRAGSRSARGPAHTDHAPPTAPLAPPSPGHAPPTGLTTPRPDRPYPGHSPTHTARDPAQTLPTAPPTPPTPRPERPKPRPHGPGPAHTAPPRASSARAPPRRGRSPSWRPRPPRQGHPDPSCRQHRRVEAGPPRPAPRQGAPGPGEEFWASRAPQGACSTARGHPTARGPRPTSWR